MNKRNEELIKRYASHPMKAGVELALTTAEKFAERSTAIKANKDLSDQGRSKEMNAQIRSALRDIRDAAGPQITEARGKLDAIQVRIKAPSFDKPTSLEP